jgi:hypothetical protein
MKIWDFVKLKPWKKYFWFDPERFYEIVEIKENLLTIFEYNNWSFLYKEKNIINPDFFEIVSLPKPIFSIWEKVFIEREWFQSYFSLISKITIKNWNKRAYLYNDFEIDNKVKIRKCTEEEISLYFNN